MSPELFERIERGITELSDGEASVYATVIQFCTDAGLGQCVAEGFYRAWFKREAMSAGIPEAVVDGKTKLTELFSAEYIKHMSGKGDI